MKIREVRYFPVEELRIRRDSDQPTLEGYAAVFNKWSEDLGGFREQIAPGAFKAALKMSDVRALFNHDPNFILGRTKSGTLRLKEDKNGLFMSVDIPDTQAGRDLLISVERGDINQQSFGFTVKKDQWEEDRAEAKVSRTLIEIEELFDVSPVTFPAYPDTTVAKRSLEDFRTEIRSCMKNEEILRLQARCAEKFYQMRRI